MLLHSVPLCNGLFLPPQSGNSYLAFLEFLIHGLVKTMSFLYFPQGNLGLLAYFTMIYHHCPIPKSLLYFRFYASSPLRVPNSVLIIYCCITIPKFSRLVILTVPTSKLTRMTVKRSHSLPFAMSFNNLLRGVLQRRFECPSDVRAVFPKAIESETAQTQ